MLIRLAFALAIMGVCLGTGSTMATAQIAEEQANVNEWAAAAEILDGAAVLIEKRGFQKGALTPVYKECLATALEHAFQDSRRSIVDFNYAREALSRVLDVPREPAALENDPLAVPYWGRHFMEWNDVPERTQEQAIAALQKAAALARDLSAGSAAQ